MRIRNSLSQKQADLFFSSHLMSPLEYCPMVWMFCSKQASKILNKTHCKALRARFNDFSATFEEMQIRPEMTDIHNKNLRLLMIEVFKIVNKSNARIMWDTLNFKDPNKYELRRGANLVVPKAQTVRAMNSFDFRMAMAWNHLPVAVKTAKDLNEFKSLLKNQIIYCQCRLCRY